jgi:dTDP-4-amino-4,6-dideoxygalactose transaminase
MTTSDAKLAERLRLLRNHGSAKRYFHEELGWNSRLDAIQAAVLRVKLKHIDSWNTQRAEHAATYDRLFTEAGLAGAESSPIHLPHRAGEARHIFHQYVVRAQRRDALRQTLTERGIATEIYYPLPLHMQNAFMYLGYAAGDFPEAERAAAEVLALPMFPELRDDEQRAVVEAISDFYS